MVSAARCHQGVSPSVWLLQFMDSVVAVARFHYYQDDTRTWVKLRQSRGARKHTHSISMIIQE